MKAITLIGASGYVGKAIVQESILRNCPLQAIARNTENITTDDLISKISLDITNEADLQKVLQDSDIVISAFNAGWSNPNLYDDYTKGALSIHQAVKKAGVKRLLVIGGAGTLYVQPGVQLVDTPDFPEMIKPGAAAVRDYFQNVLSKEKEFEWTYFSPAIEMGPHNPGTRTGTYRIGHDTPVYDQEHRSRVSVEDVAVAIIDEIENKHFVNQQFTIGY